MRLIFKFFLSNGGAQNNLKGTLFITYDGLLDPLGGSQILPYLKSISSHQKFFHVLSFEKQERYMRNADDLQNELSALGIGWTQLIFTSRAGKIGKLWDLARMYLVAIYLQCKNRFAIIHCRSYQAMQVGCLLKLVTGSKTLFDMRGLWVDERVDGGIWLQHHRLDRFVYMMYKRIEKNLLSCSDHVIVLTKRVIPELMRLSPSMTSRVTVIPCCADFDHFTLPTKSQRLTVRAQLGIPEDARVISYLGSLGTWYMLEEMLRLFAQANSLWGNVHFLIITCDWKAEHEALVRKLGISSVRDQIHVRSATRVDVPVLLGCADVMFSFIKPAYSKMASSPTKLAEAFAVGIPVISNIGIGDVDEVTKTLDGGVLVDLNNPESVNFVITHLDLIAAKGGQALHDRARSKLGLEFAETQYNHVYHELEQRFECTN